MVKFIDNIARKNGQPDLLEIEHAKTKQAIEIGDQSGLFYVPRILNFDAEKGILDFEKLEGLKTIQQVASENSYQIKLIMDRLGRSMAIVHENMVLPESMTNKLPTYWLGSSDDNVYIHGDLTGHNVCFQENNDRLVILDWSSAPILGCYHTFGSRYFDISWFISFMFYYLPAKRILTWHARMMANSFLTGYTDEAKHKLNSEKFLQFHFAIEQFRRKRFLENRKQRDLLMRMGYLTLWLWKHYRYRTYSPHFLSDKSC